MLEVMAGIYKNSETKNDGKQNRILQQKAKTIKMQMVDTKVNVDDKEISNICS